MYQKYGKRALDFILSLGGIVCLSWLLLGLAAVCGDRLRAGHAGRVLDRGG